jgi:nucleoside 2-deoxyribosyltransferase
MNGRCCVFQPFDRSVFDKRCEDVFKPAILDASLEPYRVDKDDSAAIPIDTLHEEIRSATLCLADITTHNPSVMYEIGYAIASNKDLVFVCARNGEKFPFDIQHRGIIQYDTDSASDFTVLREAISKKILGILKKQQKTEQIAIAPVKSTDGLQPHEFTALALIVGNVEGQGGVGSYLIKQEMERAGYNKAAAQIALISLGRKNFVEAFEDSDYNGDETWTAYRLLSAGEDWLLENLEKLELRRTASSPKKLTVRTPRIVSDGIGDDDVPF